MSNMKNNSIMALLHAFSIQSTRMKALEVIAKAQYNPEYSQKEIEQIRDSANEFLTAVENLPFNSEKIEVLYYSGIMPKKL